MSAATLINRRILEATQAMRAAGLPCDANAIGRALRSIRNTYADEIDSLGDEAANAEAATILCNLCGHFRRTREIVPGLALALA